MARASQFGRSHGGIYGIMDVDQADRQDMGFFICQIWEGWHCIAIIWRFLLKRGDVDLASWST